MIKRNRKSLTQVSAESRTIQIRVASEVMVSFGSTVIVGAEPKISEKKRNIKAGQSALARALKKIVDPGVRIEVLSGVPLFHADPENPAQIIRELDGKRERGVFVKGEFKISG